jgi:hypothetical protein
VDEASALSTATGREVIKLAASDEFLRSLNTVRPVYRAGIDSTGEILKTFSSYHNTTGMEVTQSLRAWNQQLPRQCLLRRDARKCPSTGAQGRCAAIQAQAGRKPTPTGIAAHSPILTVRAVIYHVMSNITGEDVMGNQNQSGSNQGGQNQAGQQPGKQQPGQQQHTQHDDRKGQQGSSQGGSGQQSGSNDRDRMDRKSGQS